MKDNENESLSIQRLPLKERKNYGLPTTLK
jgi:hypothetical protein